MSEKLENSLYIIDKEWHENIRPVFQKGKEIESKEA